MNEENTYRTGTCTCAIGSDRRLPRWFIENTSEKGSQRIRVYRTRRDRDRALDNAKFGAGWHSGPMNEGQTGIAGGIQDMTTYLDWRYDGEEEETVSTDYEKKYHDLVAALEAEAKRRKWCPDWEDFKRANGIESPRPKPPVGTINPIIKVHGRRPFIFTEGYLSTRHQRGWLPIARPHAELLTWDELVDTYSIREYDLIYPTPALASED